MIIKKHETYEITLTKNEIEILESASEILYKVQEAIKDHKFVIDPAEGEVISSHDVARARGVISGVVRVPRWDANDVVVKKSKE